LAVDLASALVLFAEATYGHTGNNKWDKLKVMTAIKSKIKVMMSTDKEIVKVETKIRINKLLSMIDEAKKDLNMSRWVHMPQDSVEYQYYKVLCGQYEAFAYYMLGEILLRDKSEESNKLAITHFRTARAIFILFAMTDMVKRMDTMISMDTANGRTISALSAVNNSILQNMRNMYERNLNTWGMGSEVTIQSGFNYVRMLGNHYHCIEAERLAAKLATISCQVHGPHHKTTIKADESLERCKKRYVTVLPDGKHFEALRYDNDGGEIICVVHGPILEPRNMEDERIHNIANTLVIPIKGCPVICHGLVREPHMNGELGEVRSVKHEGTGIIRCVVYFEKKNQESALVKPENLHIVFELQSEVS
jgi:hypothetical protein